MLKDLLWGSHLEVGKQQGFQACNAMLCFLGCLDCKMGGKVYEGFPSSLSFSAVAFKAVEMLIFSCFQPVLMRLTGQFKSFLERLWLTLPDIHLH